MNSRERLAKAFDLQVPDRPPILGGWLAAPGHIQVLAGCSEDEYWSDPFHWGLEAERVLGSDGVITVFRPVSRGSYRIVDHQVQEARAVYTPESILAEIDALPDPEEVKADFDEETEYAQLVADFRAKQARCGDIVWCKCDWELVPHLLWFTRFGHESLLMTIALYPHRYRKMMQVNAERAHQRAILWARAIREGIRPRAILTGEDLCSQQGPMVSPEYLRREYFPLVEYIFEPLLEVGAKIVWHCDGDYRILLDDIIACGVGGLQGFQPECGMDLEWIVNLRTHDGDPLLIFGPMPVTTTLPFGTPENIGAEVRRAMDLCRDRASLVFLTSNTITPDVPLENIRTFWRSVRESAW